MVEESGGDGEEVLILGAFGCAVFQNPVEIVAEEMVRVVNNIKIALKLWNLQCIVQKGIRGILKYFRVW